MVVELKGQQIRIRITSPYKYKYFETQDVGSPGKLQRIVGITTDGEYETQSWRLNLSDYESEESAIEDLESIDGLDYQSKLKAKSLIRRWFMNH